MIIQLTGYLCISPPEYETWAIPLQCLSLVSGKLPTNF